MENTDASLSDPRLGGISMKIFRTSGVFPGAILLFGLTRAAFADGLDTWTPRVSGTTNRLNGVTYGSASPAGNLFVVVGEGALLTSSNALDWTQQYFGGGILRSVAAGNGTFVAVPDNRGHIVLSSTNGISWAGHQSYPYAVWLAIESRGLSRRPVRPYWL